MDTDLTAAKSAERQTLTRAQLARMLPQQIDKLPSPAEVQGAQGEPSRRMLWVGFAWVNEGLADGTEPLLVTGS
jgi:hypothetical protein